MRFKVGDILAPSERNTFRRDRGIIIGEEKDFRGRDGYRIFWFIWQPPFSSQNSKIIGPDQSNFVDTEEKKYVEIYYQKLHK